MFYAIGMSMCYFFMLGTRGEHKRNIMWLVNVKAEFYINLESVFIGLLIKETGL